MARRSPIYPAYSTLPGIKLIDFAGWDMPLNFAAGILAEHHAVRTQAGLFDVSHMGEVEVTGGAAEAFLDWLVTNDVSSMSVGQALYTPMCYPDGGTVDDLMIYKRGDGNYLLVVNAANRDKDLAWITRENPWIERKRASGDPVPVIRDVSDDVALIAIQGPMAMRLFAEAAEFDGTGIAPFRFRDECPIFGARALVSRTGYTGEDGYEIFVPSTKAADVWTKLTAGASGSGLLPCGLGARDTLRLEARLPLYGQELSASISPLEAGLRAFVKTEKRDFCGRDALRRQQESGAPRQLIGLRMIEKAVPRHGYTVTVAGRRIGEVTSGGKAPTLDAFIALALVERGSAARDQEVSVEIAGKPRAATVVKTPFYRKTGGNSG